LLKVFKNGYVYNTDEKQFEKADILVKDGVIEGVALGLSADGAETVDCTGKYIIPGLVDVHTHGRSGFDFNTATDENIRHMRKEYAKIGTTTIMATLASATMDSLFESADAINENRKTEVGMANIAGIHLEGRYLNKIRRGAHNEGLLALPNVHELATLMERMSPLPIHISAAYELEGGEMFLRVAKSLGATCGLGHSDATYDEAVKLVKSGVTSFTHTFNAMRPLHHREPGNASAALLCDGAYAEFICDGEHIHPAMIALASRAKPEDKLVLITDSMEATGCPDGEYSIAGLPVFVKNGRAENSEGALAGSTLDLFRGMCNYMKFTGKTLEEAIPCATSNPAAMVGIDNVCGSIKSGLRADLIMINDKNTPVLESVWVSGEKI